MFFGGSQKYLQTAQKISPAYIVSALNILNEAEINYKQARNKRLHVELTIIKLSYLQQALELVNNDGTISKKKMIDGAKTIAFRALPIIKVKEALNKPQVGSIEYQDEKQKAGSKKQEAGSGKQETRNDQHTSNGKQETSNEKRETGNEKRETGNEPQETKRSQLGSLNKIREQVTQQNKNAGTVIKELTEEELYIAWGLFIEKLRKKNNHSAVTNFRAAGLKVADNSIEIITQGEIHKAFIENEKVNLIDHLQNYFNNRTLVYHITVIEKENNKDLPEKPLSTKDQYLKIIEEYPLVKELKDRLKLGLDY